MWILLYFFFLLFVWLVMVEKMFLSFCVLWWVSSFFGVLSLMMVSVFMIVSWL